MGGRRTKTVPVNGMSSAGEVEEESTKDGMCGRVGREAGGDADAEVDTDVGSESAVAFP